MKRLLAFILALSSTCQSWSAIAYVGGNNEVGQSGDPFTTSSYTGTSGSLIALGIFWKGAVDINTVTCSACSSSCVDSGAGKLTRPTDGFLQVFYCPNITGGASTYTVDFTGTPTATETNVFKDEFSGVATVSPAEASATGTASSGTTLTTGNIVTSNANDVIYAWAVSNAANVPTAGSGFTSCQAPISGGIITEYQLVTPGTYTASVGTGVGLTKGGIIGVAFKAPSSLTTVPKNLITIRGGKTSIIGASVSVK